MKCKPISDPIWQPRLQALWLAFAALYSAVANSYPLRPISSLLIVGAGSLVAALLAHVLMETSSKKIRPVLLVSFGAAVFVLPVSFRDFKDPLAGAFAFVFALMIGSLLFFSFKERVSRRLRYAYFLAIVMAVLAGAVGFPMVLVEKAVLRSIDPDNHNYVIGLQGVVSVACFGVGLAAGSRVLPDALRRSHPRRYPLLLMTALIGSVFPVLLFVGLYWKRIVLVVESPSSAIVFTAIHSIGLGGIPAVFLSRWCRIDMARRPGFRYWLPGLMLGILTAVMNGAALEVLSSKSTLRNGLIRVAVVELPTYFIVYGSVLVGLFIATRLALSAVREKQKRRRKRR